MDLWELEFFKNLLSCVLQREKHDFCEKVAKILQKIFLPAMGCNCLSKPHLWELEFFKNLLSCVLQVFCDFRVLQGQYFTIVLFGFYYVGVTTFFGRWLTTVDRIFFTLLKILVVLLLDEENPSREMLSKAKNRILLKWWCKKFLCFVKMKEYWHQHCLFVAHISIWAQPIRKHSCNSICVQPVAAQRPITWPRI